MNELDKTKIPAPVTIATADVSTHLAYMRRDIDQGNINTKQGFEEMAKKIEHINNKLDSLTDGYVTRTDFNEHQKVDQDHEQRLRVLEEKNWKVAGAAGVIGAILSVMGSYIVGLISK